MKLLLILLTSYALWASESLFDQYCGTCHLKKETSFEEMKEIRNSLLAPPISIVIQRLKEVIDLKIDDDDAKKALVVAFIKDYALQPSIDKGLCCANCFVQFGVMPSQKGRVDPDTIEEIASWAYDTY